MKRRHKKTLMLVIEMTVALVLLGGIWLGFPWNTLTLWCGGYLVGSTVRDMLS